MAKFIDFGGKAPTTKRGRGSSTRALSTERDREANLGDRVFLLKKEWLRPAQDHLRRRSPSSEPDDPESKQSCCRSCLWICGVLALCVLGALALYAGCRLVTALREETCVVLGCGSSGDDQTCQCHLDCIRDGTCCHDYGDTCVEDSEELVLIPPEAESCANYGCVDYTPDHACQCNSDCEDHGTCCADYQTACATGAAGSCAIYGCSLERRPHACQCYPDCAHDGDCCLDYVDTCRGRAQGIIATRRTSTEVSTTSTATSVTDTSATSTTTTFVSTTTTLDPDAAPMPLESYFDAPPRGFDGYTFFYHGENPLHIQADPKREMNYFLIIGDWGTPGGPGPCQLAVADAMKAYIAEQREAGMTLLFVGTVGDNFYWTGIQPQSWDVSWAAPYGVNDPSSPLFQVPWLATLGNHDYGNDDTFAFCPGVQPLFSIHGQPYAGLQMNRDRNPKRPRPSDLNTTHFWYPDYSYHYSIPEADLEVISFDTNAGFIDMLGGDEGGHKMAFKTCQGRGAVETFLSKVASASTDLLVRRAQQGTAKTVVLLQHYPGQCQKEVFMDALPDERKGHVHVLCAYGHVHDQRCDGFEGTCHTVMTGGGGGCCDHDVQAGFTAVQLTADGGFEVDVESGRVKLPSKGCKWKEGLL